MTTIINLYCGPGGGKSTSASYLYYLFKSRSMNAELVREYAKDLAWQNYHITKYDQASITGEQIRRESTLLNKVEYIITDSPVMLGMYYASISESLICNSVKQLIVSYYTQLSLDNHKCIHIVLNRSKPYLAAGRYQTFEQAIDIDVAMLDMLDNNDIEYTLSDTDSKSLDALFETICNKTN